MLKLIRETWEEIAFLSALSGGFWYTLEPPIGNSSGVFSGFVGAFALGAALAVRCAMLYWNANSRVVISIMALAIVFLLAAVPAFAIYVVTRSNLVIDYTSNGEVMEVVRGLEYHPEVLAVREEDFQTDHDLLNSAGGLAGRDLVWTRDSIMEAELQLTVGYVLSFLFTLLSTVFFIEIFRIRRLSNEAARVAAGNGGQD